MNQRMKISFILGVFMMVFPFFGILYCVGLLDDLFMKKVDFRFITYCDVSWVEAEDIFMVDEYGAPAHRPTAMNVDVSFGTVQEENWRYSNEDLMFRVALRPLIIDFKPDPTINLVHFSCRRSVLEILGVASAMLHQGDPSTYGRDYAYRIAKKISNNGRIEIGEDDLPPLLSSSPIYGPDARNLTDINFIIKDVFSDVMHRRYLHIKFDVGIHIENIPNEFMHLKEKIHEANRRSLFDFSLNMTNTFDKYELDDVELFDADVRTTRSRTQENFSIMDIPLKNELKVSFGDYGDRSATDFMLIMLSAIIGVGASLTTEAFLSSGIFGAVKAGIAEGVDYHSLIKEINDLKAHRETSKTNPMQQSTSESRFAGERSGEDSS